MTDTLSDLYHGLGRLQLGRDHSALPEPSSPTAEASTAESEYTVESGINSDDVVFDVSRTGWEAFRARLGHLGDPTCESIAGTSSTIKSPTPETILAPTSHPTVFNNTATNTINKKDRRPATYADDLSPSDMDLIRSLRMHGRSTQRTGSMHRSQTPRRFPEMPRPKTDRVRKSRVPLVKTLTSSTFSRHRVSGDEADAASGDEGAVESEADVDMED